MLIKKQVRLPLQLSEWVRNESKRLGTSEEGFIRAAIISYKNRSS